MPTDRAPRKPPYYAYVIVGAGLAGASVAWHLRQRGVTDVLVLERAQTPGEHSSGRNAAIVREDQDSKALDALARESVAMLRSGSLAPFRPTGGFHLDDGTTDIASHAPFAAGHGTARPGDGVVDVAALLATYLRGQTLWTGVTVRGFAQVGACIDVDTSLGPVHAGVLINAAGAWAGALGDLPLVPTNRHLHVSGPMPEIDPDAPYVWDLEHGYYLRPESGGLLLCACDEVAGTPGEPGVDPHAVEDLAEKLRQHQPALEGVEIKRTWVGQRTFAPDRCPVIGFDPRVPGVFHMAAFGGFGVTLSYAAGRYAAALLLGQAEVDPQLGVGRVVTPVEHA